MLNFLKKNKDESKNTLSVTSLACLLIHAAKIDENYSSKEKKIIEETLIKLGVDEKEILDILREYNLEISVIVDSGGGIGCSHTDEGEGVEYLVEIITLDYSILSQ